MPHSKGYIDRRQWARLPVQLNIRFKQISDPEDSFIREITNSIGKGGLFIRTKKSYPAKTELDIELSIKNKTIVAQGIVKYVVPFDESAGGVQFPGIGIQFTMIPTEDQEFIDSFVKEGLKKLDK